MFDIGWSELMVLGAVALIVVGPKDLPGLLRTLGQVAGKARRMAREFQGAMDEAAREADVKELRDVQKSMSDWNRRIGTGSAKAYAEKMMSGASDAPRAAASGDPAAERPAPSAGAAPPSAGSPGAASAEPAPDSADAPPPREG